MRNHPDVTAWMPAYAPSVALYIVERTSARLTVNRLIVAQLALVQTSRRMSAAGEEIRYLRSIFVPRTCRGLCVFEADSPDLVRRLNVAAKVEFSSIDEALDLPPPALDNP